MTPKPPSSSDGSALPPRHRPNMGNLAKDTTEMDLWAFDDLDSLEETAPRAEPPKTTRLGIPVPRNPDSAAAEKEGNPSSGKKSAPRPDFGGSDDITVNIKKGGKSRIAKSATGQASSGHSKPGRDFDDLDSWEEPTPVVAPAKTLGEMPVSKETDLPKPGPALQPLAVESIPEAIPEPVPEDDLDEFTPHPKEGVAPVSLRLMPDLTKVERIGLVSLLALIVIGGGVFYFNTISRLPTGVERAEANDFPITGSKISVNSAVTFWRKPITTGENADTVRRDALLIPVVDLATSGGPAAVRVFFRNSDGELVGDAVSRSVRGGMKFQIAATDGFSDMGMHAAYRTGQGKPWTIEVLEAPSEDSPAKAFKRLFEMNIAPDRR